MKKGLLLAVRCYVSWGFLSIFWKFLGDIDSYEVFAYRIRKYIGAYTAAMNGVDAVVFTGGIGEHSSLSRSKILADMTYLGIELDEQRNSHNCSFIQTDASKVSVMIVPANEELAIAQDTLSILSR